MSQFKCQCHTKLYYQTTPIFCSFDVPNLQFFCGGWVENLKLEGKYKVTGKLLIAPIEGEGTFTATVGTYKKYFGTKIRI